jgi:AcrR family transcriptional regulator
MSIEDISVSNNFSSEPQESVTRRRGAVLENALLEAAWDELVRGGFGGFTIEGVAARSGTSRTVIYRRWATRPELAVAAVRHYWETHRVADPDSGTLRQDLIEYMFEGSIKRVDFLVFFTGVGMQEYFKETQTSFDDFRKEILPSEILLDEIYRRAIERGEIDPQKLSSRVASLPFDLLRQEAFMTGKPVPRSAVEEIVDQIFLPLVRFPR